MTYKFIIRANQINKQGKTNIKLRITQFRKQKYIATPFYIEPRFFNNEQGKVNHKHKLHLHINRELNKFSLEFENKLFSIDNFDNLQLDFLLKEFERINKGNFVLLEEYVNSIKDQIKAETSQANYKMYLRVINHVLQFKKDVYLIEINHDFIKAFEVYLLERRNTTKTTSLYIATLKAIVNRAKKENII